MRRIAALVTTFALWSTSAFGFDFNSTYYGVYEYSINGTTYVYIVPKNSFLIIGVEQPTPIMFMPNTTGFAAVLQGDGTLGPFQKTNITANSLPVAAVPSSYKLFSGDFDGNGTPDLLLQGAGTRYSYVLTTNATGNVQVYFSFGNDLSSNNYPQIAVFDADQNGRADIVATDVSGNSTTYFSSSYGQWFAPASNGSGSSMNVSLVGSIEGKFRVDESGDATYSIDVLSAPGTAGVAPHISLNYSSGGGDGVMGLGWSVGGLSAVSRCRQTLAQDNNATAITLGADDRFCLDGQRLILVSGTYGAPNSRYRTEIDGYALVTANGGSSGNPASFTVERKDGSRSEYGNGYGSAIVLNSNGTILGWALSRFQDSVGNGIRFSYTTNSSTNEQVISRIDYAYGSDSGTINNSSTYIQFNYEVRPDRGSGYMAGYGIQRTQRLSKIISYSSGVELRSYNLVYRMASLSNGKSVLEKIFECVGSSCLSPTQFGWTAAQSGFGGGSTVDTITSSDIVSLRTADINGDGKQDLIYIAKSGSAWNAYYRLSIGAGYGAPVWIAQVDDASANIVAMDFNNDGKDDVLIGRKNQNWYVGLGGANGLSALTDLRVPYNANGQFVDINGDGLADMVYPPSSGATLFYRYLQRSQAGPYWTYAFGEERSSALMLPDNSTPNSIATAPYTTLTPIVTDFNGDGRADVLGIAAFSIGYPYYIGINWLVAFNAGNGGQFSGSQSINAGNQPITASTRKVADVNGDGLPDVLIKINNSWQAYLNNGTAFVPSATIGTIPNEFAFQLVDFNNDGYPDLIYPDAGALQVRYYQPDTGAFAPAVSTGFAVGNPNYEQYQFTDVDGDGHLDLLRVVFNGSSSNSIYLYRSVNAGAVTQRVTSIDNGFGNLTTITYKPLTDSSVYSKRADANDAAVWPANVPPVFDIVAPSYVVAGVSSTAPRAHDTAPNQVNYGATSSVNYQYSGLKLQASGRGSLGFGAITTTDLQTGVKTITTYRQDFPFIGQPLSTVVQSDSNVTVKLSVNTPVANTLTGADGTKYYQLYVQQVIDQAWDPISGFETSYVVTSTDGIDSWGNVTATTTTTYAPPNHSYLTQKITSNTYGTTPDEQRLGRLSSSTVSHRRAGATDISRTSTFTYYASGNLKGLIKSETVSGTANGVTVAGPTTTYLYDSFGNKTCASRGNDVDPATVCTIGTGNRYSKTTYDSSGRFVASSISRFNTGAGWVEQVAETVLARNAYGQPLQVQGLNGLLTNYTYDVLGRESQRSDNTGAWVATTYNRYGIGGAQYAMTTRAANGAEATQYFDALGRVIAKTQIGFDGRVISSETEYDSSGRVKRESAPHYSGDTVYWSTNKYDAFRLTGQQVPASNGQMAESSLTYEIDGAHRTKIITTNALLQTRAEYRNVAGELEQVDDPLGGSIVYTYDAVGQLIKTATTASQGGAPLTINTYLEYDPLGRKTKLCDNAKGTWYYQYNAFGDMAEQYKVMQDPNGITKLGDLAAALNNGSVQMQRTHMNYDLAGRLIARTDYRENNVAEGTSTWVYDTAAHGLGQLTQESGGGLTRTYAYDALGRPASTMHNDGDSSYLLTVSYDNIGRAYQQTDALGTDSGTLTTYNNYGYPMSVIDLASNHEISRVQAMDARGNVTQVVIGNGATSIWTYDQGSGLLLNQKAVIGTLTLQNLSYNWDVLGNQTSRWDRGLISAANNTYKNLQQSFCYDSLNRLAKTYDGTLNGACLNIAPAQQDQEYDGFGNIVRKKGIGVYTYGYNAQRAYLLQSTGDGVSYTYDGVGNLVSDSSNRTLHYTVFDKPDVITKLNNTISFAYGADRDYYKRVDSDGTSTTTTFRVGGVEKVVKPDGSYDFKRYIAGVAIWNHHFSSTGVQTALDQQYSYKDALGSVVLITDALANIKQQTAFNAWGERVSTSDWQTLLPASGFMPVYQQFTTQGYTGQDMLDAVGLIHYGGRIYDARLGRFMQADPIVQDALDLQAYNRYAYVRNNPLTLTDPSGFSWLSKAWRGAKRAFHQVSRWVGYAAAHVIDFSSRWTGTYAVLGRINPQIEQLGLSVASVFCGPFAPACAAAGSYAIARSHGTSINDAAKGSAVAGASAWAFTQVGGAFTQTPIEAFGTRTLGNALRYTAADVAAHGLVGGVMSSLSGGRFGDGFVAAGLSTGLSLNNLVQGEGVGAIAGRVALAALSGGTVSELTGGKFANGAMSAAFSQAFNEELHLLERSVKQLIDQYNQEENTIKKATAIMTEINAMEAKGELRASEAANLWGDAYEIRRDAVVRQASVVSALALKGQAAVAQFMFDRAVGKVFEAIGGTAEAIYNVYDRYNTAKDISETAEEWSK